MARQSRPKAMLASNPPTTPPTIAMGLYMSLSVIRSSFP
jgi:hypothetical protein